MVDFNSLEYAKLMGQLAAARDIAMLGFGLPLSLVGFVAGGFLGAGGDPEAPSNPARIVVGALTGAIVLGGAGAIAGYGLYALDRSVITGCITPTGINRDGCRLMRAFPGAEVTPPRQKSQRFGQNPWGAELPRGVALSVPAGDVPKCSRKKTGDGSSIRPASPFGWKLAYTSVGWKLG